MKPKLDILPAAQKKLWPLLADVPKEFILYGGTAIALQLGHRESIDFDFFSDQPLDRTTLIRSLPFLSTATLVQPEINTLNCIVEFQEGPVKLQFFSGLGQRQKRIEPPLQCDDNHLLIAALRDLLATKLNTIQLRAEIKDYIDIYALLKHGLTLSDGLGCARAIYGKPFDPATSLRALCSYHDGYLPEISSAIKNYLIDAAKQVDHIPEIKTIN